jgi:hypothetical protein
MLGHDWKIFVDEQALVYDVDLELAASRRPPENSNSSGEQIAAG